MSQREKRRWPFEAAPHQVAPLLLYRVTARSASRNRRHTHPTDSSSPQSERKSRDFSGSNPFLDAVSIFVVGSPVRLAAAMARVRPAAPRTSASGLATFFRRAMYSARLVELVPSRMWAGLVQPAKSHWWQIAASSAPDHPAAGSHHGQLIGEEVCGDGAAPDWAGKARSAGTIRDLLTTPRQSIPNTSHVRACCASPRTARRRLGRRDMTANASRNTDGPRLTDQNEVSPLNRARQGHRDRTGDPPAGRPWRLPHLDRPNHPGEIMLSVIRRSHGPAARRPGLAAVPVASALNLPANKQPRV